MLPAKSDAYSEVDQFCREHKRATLLLMVAATDYAAARCLLLNGLFAGLVLGAQAIEKVLKAYLIFSDPAYDVRKHSHSLPRLLEQVSLRFPTTRSPELAAIVAKFGHHYETRYPDNKDASKSMSTADLYELDWAVVFLNENLPCPRNVKYRTGMYATITFSLQPLSTPTPAEFWTKQGNQSLQGLMPRINDEYRVVIAEMYPKADANSEA